MIKDIKKTNELLQDLIGVTLKTKRTLTWVNIINILTLIAIAYFAFK